MKRDFLKEERTPDRKTRLESEDMDDKTLIWSVMLYGSETWTMRKDDIKKYWRTSKCGYGETKETKEMDWTYNLRHLEETRC